MNRPLALATGVVLIIAGSIWILQGFDVAFAPESFMTANRWWILWGGIAGIAGLAILMRNRH